jgi:hypothetical protein
VDILVNQLKGKKAAQNSTTSNPSDENEIKNNIIRALIGQVEIWMDPSYDLWCVSLRCLFKRPLIFERTLQFRTGG